MHRRRFEDKVAVVTGAGSGIGRATALLFAREGARVAVLDIDREAAAAVVSEIGGVASDEFEQGASTHVSSAQAENTGGDRSAGAFVCDVGDQRAVLQTFDDVAASFGGIDVLVNNAGIAHVGTVENTSEADFDRIYRVNVKGVYNCLLAGVRAMKGRGGAIVNMASTVSCVGIPDRFAYSMSKGAVLTMTLSVACDYLHENIRCNAVSPARIHTPFVDGFLEANYPDRREEMFERLSMSQPIGRMGAPEEVAELVAYLASDDAGFVTGANFPIDGGFITLKP